MKGVNMEELPYGELLSIYSKSISLIIWNPLTANIIGHIPSHSLLYSGCRMNDTMILSWDYGMIGCPI